MDSFATFNCQLLFLDTISWLGATAATTTTAATAAEPDILTGSKPNRNTSLRMMRGGGGKGNETR